MYVTWAIYVQESQPLEATACGIWRYICWWAFEHATQHRNIAVSYMENHMNKHSSHLVLHMPVPTCLLQCLFNTADLSCINSPSFFSYPHLIYSKMLWTNIFCDVNPAASGRCTGGVVLFPSWAFALSMLVTPTWFVFPEVLKTCLRNSFVHNRSWNRRPESCKMSQFSIIHTCWQMLAHPSKDRTCMLLMFHRVVMLSFSFL